MKVVIAIVVIVAVVAVVLIVLYVVRRPRDGIGDFRRHIDALSPESRREMQDRMREQQERQDPGAGQS